MNKHHSKRTIFICVVFATLILIIFLLFCIFRGGYKKALRDYFEGISTNNAEKCFAALVPDDVADFYKKDSDSDLDYMVQLLGGFTAKTSYYKLNEDLGDDLTILFKVTDKSPLSDSELQDSEDYYNYLFRDTVSLKVTEGYNVTLDITIKGDRGKAENIEATTIVVKVNGDWVLYEGIYCAKYEEL